MFLSVDKKRAPTCESDTRLKLSDRASGKDRDRPTADSIFLAEHSINCIVNTYATRSLTILCFVQAIIIDVRLRKVSGIFKPDLVSSRCNKIE